MKIAVIGSGISGLSSAYYLSKKYKVDLFEKDDHFGGHSYTIEIEYEKKRSKKKRNTKYKAQYNLQTTKYKLQYENTKCT